MNLNDLYTKLCKLTEPIVVANDQSMTIEVESIDQYNPQTSLLH